MPTGYTADIEKDIPFERFIWDCARAFGALVTMREDARDAPIPARFDPTDYHVNKLAEERHERARLIAMRNTEADAEAAREYATAHASHEARLVEKRALKAKYLAMRAKVEAWEPPSDEHESLKTFMLQQIDSSIDGDCCERYMDAPKLLTGSEWRKVKLDMLDHSIQYHHNEHAKEVARTEKRNAWLAALRASVPYPA